VNDVLNSVLMTPEPIPTAIFDLCS